MPINSQKNSIFGNAKEKIRKLLANLMLGY